MCIRDRSCSVPFCPSLKVFDFSLDGDWKKDANSTFTHASLQKENFPPSFTICAAFMVEHWGKVGGPQSPLFLVLDNCPHTTTVGRCYSDQQWLYVSLYAAQDNTQYTVHLSGVKLTVKDYSLFFPMQWTRFCLSYSYHPKNSWGKFVVNGNQIMEKEITWIFQTSYMNRISSVI